MNILFLTPRLPFPPNRGDRVRTFNFARVLSRRHSLYLLSFVQSQDEVQYVDHLKDYFEDIDIVLLPAWQSYLSMALHCFSSEPLQVSFYRSAGMQARVDRVLADKCFDVIYVFHLRMAPYVSGRKGLYKILDLTDAVSIFMRRMLRHRPFYLKPILYLEWLRVRRYEPYVGRKFDECWIVSDADKQAIHENTSLNITVIPQAVDVEYFSSDESEDDGTVLLFVGYMGVESVCAITYFYETVFPLIRKRFPAIRFYVVGANSPPEISQLARDKSVIVTGFVEDLRPYYNKAAVLVAPMRFVAGMQTKILEAMAMEVPVVTTAWGNEGIDARHGEEIFVADDAPEFANRVIQLLNDLRLRQKMGKKAREFVKNRFTWDLAARRMEEIRRIISKSR